MPLATRNFKNIILLILKDKVASTACGFFRRTKLFSHKTKGAPSPKARDFHEFFHSAEVNERLLTKKLVNIVLLL